MNGIQTQRWKKAKQIEKRSAVQDSRTETSRKWIQIDIPREKTTDKYKKKESMLKDARSCRNHWSQLTLHKIIEEKRTH